jgi:FAD/FMN-containing dehydrogenase
MTKTDWTAFAQSLAPVRVITEPALVRQKSRDFFWYSPILKAELNRKSADLVVVPKDQDEALRAIGACAQFRIPLVVRGGGTGNYGQLVPLKGGILLDTAKLDRALFVRPGAARFEAGANLVEIDRQARAIGWEMRMHPSTKRMSAIGGFVAGGAAGVGSAMLGQLRDWGSIPGVRVATCEAVPRVLDLRGRDVAGATHAYGTTGIILEVEIALAPVWPWFDSVVAFDDFMDAARFGQALGEADGIVKKEIAVCAWPIPAWFKALKTECPEGKHVAFCMIAESDRAAYEALADLRVLLEPHDAAGPQGRQGRHLPADRLPDRPQSRSRREDVPPLRRRSDAASRVPAPLRPGQQLGAAGRSLDDQGAALRDHPPPRGGGLHHPEPAHLHARGQGPQGGRRRPPARLQAPRRPARPA